MITKAQLKLLTEAVDEAEGRRVVLVINDCATDAFDKRIRAMRKALEAVKPFVGVKQP